MLAHASNVGSIIKEPFYVYILSYPMVFIPYSGKFSKGLFSKISKMANHFLKYCFEFSIATQLGE